MIIKKVKYSYKGIPISNITIDKIYDVIEFHSPNQITFINDIGQKCYSYTDINMFIDATSEYRNDIIDEILK